jgi:hypothetical protein
MNKQEANILLDEVKSGVNHPLPLINQALVTTGDINGSLRLVHDVSRRFHSYDYSHATYFIFED